MDALDGLKKSIDELGPVISNLVLEADKARDEIKFLKQQVVTRDCLIETQSETIAELRSQVVEVN